jgi:hypothetical protein
MFSLYGVHFLVLIFGILVIWLIRRKYRKITPMEFTVIIILYVLLVLLFTEPIVNWIRRMQF